MTTRFLPYATTPGRLAAQLFSDVAVFVWTGAWLIVGMAVNDAVSAIADAGRKVENGANGIASNLASAGDGAEHIPVVGDAVGKPLVLASEAAMDVARAGHSLDMTGSWLAGLLGVSVIAVPLLIVVVPWLVLRVRFFRRKWIVTGMAANPAGEQLLALRALTNRPPAKLATVGADPVGGWRREDPATIRALASLELRAAGITVRAD